MAEQNPGFEAEWDKARGRLFPAVPPPTRAETEAFTQRVMARIPVEEGAWGRTGWLAPAMAFSAAALLLSFTLPVVDEESSEPFLVAALPSDAEDLLGFPLEER